MQNQSNSNDVNLEEIINSFKEKIRKLQDEISEKDSEIAQLKFKLMKYDNANKANNQFINNNMYQMNPMINNGNKMNMNMINNPFNMMNNQFNMNNMMNNFQMNNQMNQDQLIKDLSIKVKMENGKEIQVQCKSDDKMETFIKFFGIKASIDKVEDYDFIIIKEEEAKLDSSIEQNGIKQKDYILAKKKLDNNKEDQSLNDEKEDQSLNDKKEPHFIKENPGILGEQIDVQFYASNGIKSIIPIGLNNTIKDAYNLYCNKLDISYSDIDTNIIFLYNGCKLSYEDNRTLKQIGFRNKGLINVIFSCNVIGA